MLQLANENILGKLHLHTSHGGSSATHSQTTTELNAKDPHSPKSAEVELCNTRWNELVNSARDRGLTDEKLQERVQKARELGNLGAHIRDDDKPS